MERVKGERENLVEMGKNTKDTDFLTSQLTQMSGLLRKTSIHRSRDRASGVPLEILESVGDWQTLTTYLWELHLTPKLTSL